MIALLILGLVFYWSEVRPNVAKRICYKEAREKAIEKRKEDDSATFIFDRNHWKGGPEPAYIQEHLDIIAKESKSYEDDYVMYRKLCLQSKGL